MIETLRDFKKLTWILDRLVPTRCKELHVDGCIQAGLLDDVFFGNRPSFAKPREDARAVRRRDLLGCLARVVDASIGRAAGEQGMEREQGQEDEKRSGQRSDEA